MNALVANGLPLLLATILAAGILAAVRMLSKIAKSVGNIDKIQGGIKTLFEVNDKQNHVQQSTLEIIGAILEAVKDGICNGNIKSAEERQERALAIAKEAREAAQEFLIDQSVGKGA